ncbi:MAG: hypothetical protein ABEJ03_01910 [Candidatus Nanohaloarchaea archaeon]
MNKDSGKTVEDGPPKDQQPITEYADEPNIKTASEAMTLYALGFFPAAVESVRHRTPPALSEFKGYTAYSAQGWMDEFPAYGQLIEKAPVLDEELSGIIAGFRKYQRDPEGVPFVMKEIPLRSTQKAGLVAAEELLEPSRNYINHQMVADRAEEEYGLDITNTAASRGISNLTTFIGIDRQEINRGQRSIDVKKIRQYEEEIERYLFCVDVTPGYIVNNEGSQNDRNEDQGRKAKTRALSREETREKDPLEMPDIERAAGEEIEFEGETYLISELSSGVGSSEYYPLKDTEGTYWTLPELTGGLEEGERYLFRSDSDITGSVPGTKGAVPVSNRPVKSLSDLADLLERQ